MQLLVTHEQHATKCGNEFYFKGLGGYSVLSRHYLYKLERAILVVRTDDQTHDAPEDGWSRADGTGIEIHPVPEFGSILSLCKHFLKINGLLAPAIDKCDRYLVRLPGLCGILACIALLLKGKRYAVEFAGHPTESLAQQYADAGRRRPLLLWSLNSVTRFCLRRAVAVTYRSNYLRREYPGKFPDRECVFSSVQLDSKFITAPRPAEHFQTSPFRVVTVGRLMREKGQAILIDAVAEARTMTGEDIRLRFIGDGPLLNELREQAEKLGIAEACEFPGSVPWGEELFAQLDGQHLFVLPSLTEGMPRALIEAMVRGLPALGSNCGGIPELLGQESLFGRGNKTELAEKIADLVKNRDKLASMSRENFEASKQHWPESLAREKDRFWELVLTYAK